MAHDFALLNGHQYMSLTTYRKDGTPVVTPVWFYLDGTQLFVTTEDSAYKVKRIRHNPDVIVAPCDARGNLLSDERATGHAKVYTADSERGRYMEKQLAKKYGFIYWAINLVGKFRKTHYVYIEIDPVAVAKTEPKLEKIAV